jgi:3-dehydroquinate synthetase
MRRDKKVTAGAMTLILARGVGQALVSTGVSEKKVEEFLTRKFEPLDGKQGLR